MAGEDQERFEDYLELEHYIEELHVGHTAHPPSELTPTQARIYRMVALFHSASTEEGQPRPEFAAELQARLEQELQQPAKPRHCTASQIRLRQYPTWSLCHAWKRELHNTEWSSSSRSGCRRIPEQNEAKSPVATEVRFAKRAILVALSLLTVVIASCGGSGGNSSGSGTDVHMGDTTFLQSSVTISKGSSLNLIDDVAVTHIIGNGSWVNGVIKPAIEPGVPTVNNLTFNSAGQSMTIGPFNTAGTYHLYCSVHVNMNLTVIVQ